MRFPRRFLTLFTLALACAACSDGSSHSSAREAARRPALELTFSDSPVELTNITADFAADVRYGDAGRNLFDIFLPDCKDPTPLVIHFHGGGFTGGDKSDTYSIQGEIIREFLRNCVAFAAINYTLLEVPEEGGDLEAAAAQGGVLTPLQDAARALQFMRYHYESLHIEPENVAAYGFSGGAGASLWLGTHDDMADPDNADPVLRESTRVKAVGALVTQSTYDILDWEEILQPIITPFAEFFGGTDVLTVAEAIGATNYLLTFLGVSSVDDLESAELAEYRANVDMLELMDAGDAPVYTHNLQTGTDDLLNLLLHHALHALAIKERADEVGLVSVAYSSDSNFPLQDPSGETLASFLMGYIL